MSHIGVGAVVTRPSLRTVRAVFPHTALRIFSLHRREGWCPRRSTKVIQMLDQREKAVMSKERVGPAWMVATAGADPAPFRAAAQQTAQSSAQPAVHQPKRSLTVARAEEVEPAPLDRCQFARKSIAGCPDECAVSWRAAGAAIYPRSSCEAIVVCPGSASPDSQNPLPVERFGSSPDSASVPIRASVSRIVSSICSASSRLWQSATTSSA